LPRASILAGGTQASHGCDRTRSIRTRRAARDEDLEKAASIRSLGDAGESSTIKPRLLQTPVSGVREATGRSHGARKRRSVLSKRNRKSCCAESSSRALGLGGTVIVSGVSFGTSPAAHRQKPQGGTAKGLHKAIPRSESICARCIKLGTSALPARSRFPARVEFAATGTRVRPSSRGAASPQLASAFGACRSSQAVPVALEVLRFSLAERTAFVGRENRT